MVAFRPTSHEKKIVNPTVLFFTGRSHLQFSADHFLHPEAKKSGWEMYNFMFPARSLPCPLIPHGIHVVPHGICPSHMEYLLAKISLILVIFFHLHSTWNQVDSMWIPPFHMEFPHGFHVDSMWIPCGKMDSPTTNIRIIEIIVQINTKQ